jgi:hypothetical protein
MAAGSYEQRFGGRNTTRYGVSNKELPALSIQCFEQRHSECSGYCLPFEPSTPCECNHHAAEKESNDAE